MFSLRRSVLFKGLYRNMSTTRPAPLLLTPSQVSRLPPQTTVLIDTSWFMPNSPRKPKEEFAALRIPNARFLDIDEVASHTEEGATMGLKHMMPEPQVFAQACGRTFRATVRRLLNTTVSHFRKVRYYTRLSCRFVRPQCLLFILKFILLHQIRYARGVLISASSVYVPRE